MELLKLLLVDDERIILKGLQETYEWEEMGYQVVAAAQSGEAALALIEDEEPDVVITDVRMKKISGLELIEKTKLSYPHIKFIVLSAYKDFEYAKKACEEGALSYLVKPVEDEELEAVMAKAYRLCMSERRTREKFENWHKLLEEDQGSFQRQMLERFLKGVIEEKELQLLAADRLFADSGVKTYFCAVCVDLDAVYKVTRQIEYDAKKILLFMALEEQIQKKYQMWQYNNADGSRIFLIRLGESGETFELKTMIEGIKSRSGYEIVSAISNSYAGPGGMKTAYRQALKLYEIACEAGAGLLEVTGGAEIAETPHYFEEVENRILKVMRKNAGDSLREAFEKMVYSIPSQENLAKTYLHRLAVQVEVMLDDSYEMSDNIRMGFANFYSMLNRYSLMRLIDILFRLLQTVIEERLTLAPALTEEYFSDYMNNALEYIREHLSEEELSITTVAEKVYLNPVYFGRLFKNVMGMTFKKYILNERMELAKKLILKNDDSIAEIAERVGIPNPSYFSQLYKQATGMLPSEYKKVHME